MTTTAKKVKNMGWTSLKALTEQEGRSAFVLRDWDKNKPKLFAEFLEQATARRDK